MQETYLHCKLAWIGTLQKENKGKTKLILPTILIQLKST